MNATKTQPEISTLPPQNFQFSLRTLIVGFTVLCVFLSVTSIIAERHRRIREAESFFSELGTWELTKGPGDVLVLRDQAKLKGDDLAKLKYLHTFGGIDLANTSVSDDDMDHLCALHNLRYIDVRNTNVTTAGRLALRKKFPDCTIF